MEKKEKFARLGIASKGFVYVLIGGLTFMAAAGMGGDTSGSSGALSSLKGSTFGTILLALTAFGLVGYTFWRFYQALVDPEGKGDDAKGLGKRAAYFISAILYGFLAFSAIQILLGNGSGGGGGQESLIAKILTKTYGQIIVGIIALIIFGKALYQIYRAYTGKYKEKLQRMQMGPKAQKIVNNFGAIGYTARGVVIGIIAFLTFRAALSSDSSQAGGTKDAFQFLQNEFGTVVLAIIAVGLILYGIFVLVKAKYRKINLH